jgi:DNA-binding NtrC family response regulator
LTQGHETILLVEDEPAILKLEAQMLESLGYLVLSAPTPGAALRLAGEHGGRIDLLMSDVIMPDMNGHELARAVTRLRPGIRCLLVSGYTDDIIASEDMLKEGFHFMQKPFSMGELASGVRGALDGVR